MRKQILAIVLATVVLSGYAMAVSAQGGPAPPQKSRAAPSTEAFERQMKAMQEMHQKIQAAKTPAERAALMDEHMKLMSSGMGIMQQMRATMHGMGGQAGMAAGKGMPPDLAARNQLMEKRMEMMEHMMQMMMDRLPAAK